MIQTAITTPAVCARTNIVRNGTNKCGHAQYYCKDCGAHRVLEPAPGYSPRAKRQILDTYRSGPVSGVWGASLAWSGRPGCRGLKALVQRLPTLKDTLRPPQADAVLKRNELWNSKCSRRTISVRIVAFVATTWTGVMYGADV